MLPDMKQVWQNNLRRLVSGLPDKKQGWQTRNESANQTCFETGSFEMNLPDQFLVFLELQGQRLYVRLEKALYGLRRAPLAWHRTLSDALSEFGGLPTSETTVYRFEWGSSFMLAL